MSNDVPRMTLKLGTHQPAVDARIESWRAEETCRRIWERDHEVWSKDPVPELTSRLGWLDLPSTMRSQVAQFETVAESTMAAGHTRVVLLGMGGSSLAPEVFASVYGSTASHPPLTILDSTHPIAVQNLERQIDPARTLFLVSSKSGTTLETMSLFRTMWDRVGRTIEQPGRNFVAITDAGSSLEGLARERGFSQIINSPPDVGGRYSALSPFGLVPAALIGVDVSRLLTRSQIMAEASAATVADPDNPGLVLGAVLGELALAGVDKVTFVTSPALAAFPAWIEQLVAESTGKNGKGILPVDSEPALPLKSYGSDRLFVGIQLRGDTLLDEQLDLDGLAESGHPVVMIEMTDKTDLGQEIFRWEMATAAASAVLGINPFDQPDVQLAKELAKRAMAEQRGEKHHETPGRISIADDRALGEALGSWVTASPGDYFSIQAYLSPESDTTANLQQLRATLAQHTGLATTLGYGPRFLHSTGQLHKGGPNTGRFLQLVDSVSGDLAVPETDYTFGTLIEAQALGDYQALLQRDRNVLSIDLGSDTSGGLHRLSDTLNSLMGP
ncbi:MAG: hypothetical protein JSW51_01525 [Gemmatimonadota bacterium]|nr:MAG: hypothetical protein JSW51_01525 [Gemmatimonadota bacterium]